MSLAVRARPWADIVAHFEAVQGGVMRPMACLVERIAAKYDGLLFAATSMHTLLVSPAPEFDMSHDTLRIEQLGDVVHFEFHSRPDRQPTWKRCTPADADAAFDRLERFVRQHAWVVSYDPVA